MPLSLLVHAAAGFLNNPGERLPSNYGPRVQVAEYIVTVRLCGAAHLDAEPLRKCLLVRKHDNVCQDAQVSGCRPGELPSTCARMHTLLPRRGASCHPMN